jgi:hypothetical protein
MKRLNRIETLEEAALEQRREALRDSRWRRWRSMLRYGLLVMSILTGGPAELKSVADQLVQRQATGRSVNAAEPGRPTRGREAGRGVGKGGTAPPHAVDGRTGAAAEDSRNLGFVLSVAITAETYVGSCVDVGCQLLARLSRRCRGRPLGRRSHQTPRRQSS